MNKKDRYQVVQWVCRGAKSFDIVPATWITHIEIKNKKYIASFFPPKPFTGIDNLLKDYVNPDPSWEATKIRIKGGSETLEGAELKLERVRWGEKNAYSEGGSESQAKKSQDTEALFYTEHLREEEKKILALQKKLADNDAKKNSSTDHQNDKTLLIDSDNSNGEEEDEILALQKQLANNDPKKKSNAARTNKRSGMQIILYGDEKNSETNEKISNDITEESDHDSSVDGDDEEVEQAKKKTVQLSGKINKEKTLLKKSIGRTEAQPHCSTDHQYYETFYTDGGNDEEEEEAEPPPKKIKTVVSGKKSRKIRHSAKKMIKRPDGEGQKLEKMYSIIMKINKNVERMSSGMEQQVVDLERDHNIMLPIQTVAELDNFEKKLKAKKDCRTDTITFLKEKSEEDTLLPACTRSMLRALFSRNIAIKLTSSRQSKEKIVMAQLLPVLKSCILAALKQQSKKLKTTIQKTCEQVLSECLTAATDWDNKRPKKEKIPQATKTLADYVAEEQKAIAENTNV